MIYSLHTFYKHSFNLDNRSKLVVNISASNHNGFYMI